MRLGPEKAGLVSKEVSASESEENPEGAVEGRGFEKLMPERLRPEVLREACQGISNSISCALTVADLEIVLRELFSTTDLSVTQALCACSPLPAIKSVEDN